MNQDRKSVEIETEGNTNKTMARRMAAYTQHIYQAMAAQQEKEAEE